MFEGFTKKSEISVCVQGVNDIWTILHQISVLFLRPGQFIVYPVFFFYQDFLIECIFDSLEESFELKWFSAARRNECSLVTL